MIILGRLYPRSRFVCTSPNQCARECLNSNSKLSLRIHENQLSCKRMKGYWCSSSTPWGGTISTIKKYFFIIDPPQVGVSIRGVYQLEGQFLWQPKIRIFPMILLHRNKLRCYIWFCTPCDRPCKHSLLKGLHCEWGWKYRLRTSYLCRAKCSCRSPTRGPRFL